MIELLAVLLVFAVIGGLALFKHWQWRREERAACQSQQDRPER